MQNVNSFPTLCLLYVSCHIISTRQYHLSRVRGLEAPTSTSCWAATRPRPSKVQSGVVMSCRAKIRVTIFLPKILYPWETSLRKNFLEKLCSSNSGHLPGHPSAGHFPPCRAARRGPATPRTWCSVAAAEPWIQIGNQRCSHMLFLNLFLNQHW